VDRGSQCSRQDGELEARRLGVETGDRERGQGPRR
jgi:hypothetical protein